ncbi:MAG TPA: dipeptide epimerase [Saprospiraceae bacterium]|nr:dipeptide epimerase [Saprospiraceae bacterium]
MSKFFLMLCTFQPLLLELKHPFRLATGMRTHTNAVLTTLHYEGMTGFGEAAMPPYYGENHDTASAFLQKAADYLKQWPTGTTLNQESIAAIMSAIDALAPGNNAAKASVDIALHDLWGKLENRALWQLLGVDPQLMPPTSFTLGIDTPEVLREKMQDAAPFSVIKVKLGTDHDKDIIRTVRELTDKPIYVDANQGWTDRQQALDLVDWLAENGVKLIEQPFKKDDLAAAQWLSERSQLPVFADESCLRHADLPQLAGVFHGVNIKLMKSTGLHEALRMAATARSLGMQLMVGCMTETSCGIMAAATLAPLCDYADIDGCWLIRNNPFALPEMEAGKVRLSNRPGLGVLPLRCGDTSPLR